MSDETRERLRHGVSFAMDRMTEGGVERALWDATWVAIEDLARHDVEAERARLLSAGSALAEAMKVALPWLELRANYDTVVACGAALTAWEEATKGRDLAAAPASGVVTCAHGVAICMDCATDDYTADVGAPLDGKGEEVKP
jgi:alkylhydroperoxidase family enzyme